MRLEKQELCANGFHSLQKLDGSWYLIKIVFQIICGSGNHQPQFDEQLRLIAADNSSHAIEKATQLAVCESTANGLVQWKFIAVTDVYPFTNMIDGAELFSRVTEEVKEAAYLYTLHLKAKDVLQHHLITH
jgi:Domain of unknown function (DUF4288)